MLPITNSIVRGGSIMPAPYWLRETAFVDRHIGPDAGELNEILATLGVQSLEELTAQTVPANILRSAPLDLPAPLSEADALADLRQLASQNQVWQNYIGLGYVDCHVPPVIQRNILENPGWYTQYTPYQAEIAQGRLQALLNFQTLVSDLTALPVANASLLDEGTAAAEAMVLAYRARPRQSQAQVFVVDGYALHPQTLDVLYTRAAPLGIIISTTASGMQPDEITHEVFGVCVQYPTSNGVLFDYSAVIEAAHAVGALVVMATDLLALAVLKAPGEWGADIAVGNTQRLGMPLGYGGPHAAFLAVRSELQRLIPGRLVGISKDANGQPALRLALQTREQHIRREKATSNICTAQVLPAVAVSMYAVYHGAAGLRQIAERVRGLTLTLAAGLRTAGYTLTHDLAQTAVFDTLQVFDGPRSATQILADCAAARINLRVYQNGGLGMTLGETTTLADVQQLLAIFGGGAVAPVAELPNLAAHARQSAYLTHPVFNTYHSEHQLLRYIHALQKRDLSLTHSMIALGSCTMKLNATAEMMPITWPEFAGIHPFAPLAQTAGYQMLFARLASWLNEVTGMAATSLQPNAGSQGEYAGLLAIRHYLLAQGQPERTVCLIPTSAHGTNPASAALAGMDVVLVACDALGNVDLADLRAKAVQHRAQLAAVMVTYPSTYGVFEATIGEICAIIHEQGGQVYMDGANMNAQVALCRPGDFGVDVCHLNLHKTFCIPHGGGGPGMGPICVAAHLAQYLPGHAVVSPNNNHGGAVSAAPWGSALILTIPYAYIAMMGAAGLRRATQVAIANANYVATRLEPYYPVLYKGENGRVAHECILDCSAFKELAGVTVEDIAKRLMDYGFHAPTMSWPVAGTLMVEPTESEDLAELERFCQAMIAIHSEIQAIAAGQADRLDNALKQAPHSAAVLLGAWERSYSREQAAYPLDWLRENKFWPAVSRVDNAYGDRNLVCICPPVGDWG